MKNGKGNSIVKSARMNFLHWVGYFVVIKTKNQVGEIWGEWQSYFPSQKTKALSLLSMRSRGHNT